MELLIKALPCPEQMKNIDLDKDNSIYFDWRSARYKLDLQFCRVSELTGCILSDTDAAHLMTHFLKSELGEII